MNFKYLSNLSTRWFEFKVFLVLNCCLTKVKELRLFYYFLEGGEEQMNSCLSQEY